MFSKFIAKTFQTIGAVVVIGIAGIFTLMALDSPLLDNDNLELSLKTDSEIREIFKKNKQVFDELVQLSVPCNRFDKDVSHFTYPEICSEISEALSIYEISFVNDSRHFYTQNMSSGYQKGFVYLDEPPPNIIETGFDVDPFGLTPYEKHYQKLEGNWYIVFWNISG